MNATHDGGRDDLLAHVPVPVAQAEDDRATAAALAPYEPGRVTVLHVVEKGEGVPAKTPVSQSEEVAAAAFDAFRETFPNAASHTAYARDVVDAIFGAADDVGASAIVYRSRGGGRVTQSLSEDLSLQLLTRADRPVVALPRTDAA